jgi:hypothetical protein
VGFGLLAELSYVEDCIVEYNKINFLGTIMSSALVFHLMEKMIFNCFANKKLTLDTWTIIDFVSAALNLFCFNVIGNVTPELIIDKTQKEVLNYYVICVTLVSWLRFFGYFLMVRIISKLLHTLFRMLIDTFSFMFLLACYFCIMSSVFTTLFQMPDPERFGGLLITLRTLFDALIGDYSYLDEAPNFTMSFTILMMLHVCISNVFLLNYLIAILSTVFAIMTEYGEFEYRCNKYNYIEKYSVPMMDKDGYRELVNHPPPLNFFTFPILFCTFSRSTMKGTGASFSRFIFWMENVPFIMVFCAYEAFMFPIAYFKQLLNFIAKSTCKNFFYLIPFWIIFGPVILILVGFLGDLMNFLNVLCDYKLKEEEEKEKLEDDMAKDKIILYNELMDVLRAIMHIYKKQEDEDKGRRRKLLATLQKKQAKGGMSGAQAAADFLD